MSKTVIKGNLGVALDGVRYVEMEINNHGEVTYLREDGFYEFDLELSKDTLASIAQAAHLENITIQVFIDRVLREELKNLY